MVRARALAMFLLLAGCGREPYHFVEAPGSVLLLAVVSSQGDLRSARVLVSGESGAAQTEVELIESGDRLLSWTLPPGSLVDELGLPIDPRSEEINLRSGPGPLGCGRCLVPSTRAPQIMMMGDSCSIPPFAVSRVLAKSGRRLTPALDGPEVLSRALPSLRLERRGTCGCKRPEPSALDRLEFRSVSPAVEVDYFGAAVLSGSTAVAFASHRLLIHELASGATRTIADPSASGGLPYSAVATRAGMYLSTSDQSPHAPAPAKLERIRLEGDRVNRTNLEIVALSSAPPPALTALALGPALPVERIFAYGNDGTPFERPAIAHCDADQDRCTLEAIDPLCRRDVGGDARVRRLHYEEGRGAVAITTHDFLYQTAPGDTWRCLGAEAKLPSEIRLHEMARGGRAVMVCGRGASGAAFYVAPSGDSAGLRFSEVFTSTIGSCGQSWATPRGFSFVIEDQRLDFDVDGRFLQRAALSALYGPRVAKVEPLGAERLLGRDRGNGLFLGSSEAALRGIWGGEATDGGPLLAAGGAPEEPWLISDSPLRVYHVRASTVTIWRGRDATAYYGWTVDSATIDSRSVAGSDRSPRLILVMHQRGQPRRVAQASLRGDEIASVELLNLPLTRPLAVAELTSEEMLIVAEPASFYRWSGVASTSPTDAPRPIEASFDDPETPPVEGPPDLNGAFLTGGHGAVWLVTDSALLRVSAVRAERAPLTLPPSGAVTGADASCPDALLLSVGAQQTNSVVRIAGAGARTDLVATTVELPQPRGVVGAAVGAVEDVGGTLGVFTAEGVLLRATESAERPDLGLPIRTVLSRGSQLILGGEGGRLLVGRRPD